MGKWGWNTPNEVDNPETVLIGDDHEVPIINWNCNWDAGELSKQNGV